MNIRNSSNYHVLMRNADERTNLRASDTMNLKKEIIKATECNEHEMYPYIFIDKTNHARVTGLKVYIDIFSKYRKVIMKSNLYYLIGAKDFNKRFHKIDEYVADENSQENIPESAVGSTEETEDSSGANTSTDTTGRSEDPGADTSRECSGTTPNRSNTESPIIRRESRPSRRELKRRIRQAVQRHQKRSFI